MADYSVLRNELCTRAALITKAADELFMLNNDVREFLILRDFNFLTNSMKRFFKNNLLKQIFLVLRNNQERSC